MSIRLTKYCELSLLSAYWYRKNGKVGATKEKKDLETHLAKMGTKSFNFSFYSLYFLDFSYFFSFPFYVCFSFFFVFFVTFIFVFKLWVAP